MKNNNEIRRVSTNPDEIGKPSKKNNNSQSVAGHFSAHTEKLNSDN